MGIDGHGANILLKFHTTKCDEFFFMLFLLLHALDNWFDIVEKKNITYKVIFFTMR